MGKLKVDDWTCMKWLDVRSFVWEWEIMGVVAECCKLVAENGCKLKVVYCIRQRYYFLRLVYDT